VVRELPYQQITNHMYGLIVFPSPASEIRSANGPWVLGTAAVRAVTATLLQEEYRTAIGSLEEALTIARKDNEATRKEAEDIRNLRGELSTVRADNETLQRREAELDAQVRGNAEA
jgi:hypothetical protein